jgi:hypothetical protein
MSALIVSAGISSGPDVFPFFSVLIAFCIVYSQFFGSSVSADGMFGGVFRAVLFSSCSKYSAHLNSCSSVVVSGFQARIQEFFPGGSDSVKKILP